MASEEKHRKPESSGYRIWPGVTLIAVCAFLVFVTVYFIAYKTNLIPLPEYLEVLLEKNTPAEETTETRSDAADALFTPPETEIRDIFDPGARDAYEWLVSLTSPEPYYQRMQIVYQQGDVQENVIVDLYRQEDAWKLIWTDRKSGTVRLYLCDGENLYRENVSAVTETSMTGIGSFTPENILGLLSLTELQTWENIAVSFTSDEKYLQFACQTEEGLQYAGMIALDTGLLTEMRLLREEEILLTMYTERFEIAPAQLRQTDFFTIPENGGIDR
ncbi:MAG: hypothetical protein IKY52_04020 [Clostridia bacterium]|nr:hypothetical protein [Clostridia bacterium]